MGDISTRYNDELAKLKTDAVGTPGNLAKEFVETYVLKTLSEVSYNLDVKEVDSNIEKTKKAIIVYKGNLLELAKQSDPNTPEGDLVNKYIKVMANFAYLRVAMTIFILLQQKKLTNECAAGKAAKTLEAEFRLNLQKIVKARIESNSSKFDEADEIKTAADGIVTYIESLKNQVKDLSSLISTSLPIISTFDSSNF